MFSRGKRWLAILQRYMAAYARQGLHDSARCSSSREVVKSKAHRRPRSVDGKASGSPRARMATYCAVHVPIPGISHRLLRNASVSTTPSKLILPVQTARAKARMVSARPPVRPMSPSFAAARTSGVGETGRVPERLAQGADQAARESGRALHSNLLAENRPRGEFEAVPTPGNAEAGIGLDAGS